MLPEARWRNNRPRRLMWRQPVTAVQKWSGETARLWDEHHVEGSDEVWVAPWHGEVLCAVVSQEPSLPPALPPSLPACCFLMCCCNHVSTSCASFFLSAPSSPFTLLSFPDALSVSLWLQAERSSFSTKKNVQSILFFTKTFQNHGLRDVFQNLPRNTSSWWPPPQLEISLQQLVIM